MTDRDDPLHAQREALDDLMLALGKLPHDHSKIAMRLLQVRSAQDALYEGLARRASRLPGAAEVAVDPAGDAA